jgi:hypothetical protein
MDVAGRVITCALRRPDRQTDSQAINQSAGHSTLSTKTNSIKFPRRNLEYILNTPFVSQGQLVWLCGLGSFVIDARHQNDIIINKYRREGELNLDGWSVSVCCYCTVSGKCSGLHVATLWQAIVSGFSSLISCVCTQGNVLMVCVQPWWMITISITLTRWYYIAISYVMPVRQTPGAVAALISRGTAPCYRYLAQSRS